MGEVPGEFHKRHPVPATLSLSAASEQNVAHRGVDYWWQPSKADILTTVCYSVSWCMVCKGTEKQVSSSVHTGSSAPSRSGGQHHLESTGWAHSSAWVWKEVRSPECSQVMLTLPGVRSQQGSVALKGECASLLAKGKTPTNLVLNSVGSRL